MNAAPTSTLYTIGEFSRITGLTVKALRFYHEERLLAPAAIDADSGYRYYSPEQVEIAVAIKLLREIELPVAEIREVLAQRNSQGTLVAVLERHGVDLRRRIETQKRALQLLQDFLAMERGGRPMPEGSSVVEEKTLPAVLVAGIRMKGKYSDCGKVFGKLCRAARSAVAGPPLMLLYDMEYKEEDADFEACIPLKSQRSIAGAQVRELPATRCVSYVHKGPYDQMASAYATVFAYLKSKGYRAAAPCREIYLKGPGMIFRGNPKNYLTELQVPIG